MFCRAVVVSVGEWPLLDVINQSQHYLSADSPGLYFQMKVTTLGWWSGWSQVKLCSPPSPAASSLEMKEKISRGGFKIDHNYVAHHTDTQLHTNYIFSIFTLHLVRFFTLKKLN